MTILSAVGSLFGSSSGSSKSSGSSGLYSGSNSSAISTPVTTTAGGGNTQNFNLGSLGIGTSSGGMPSWVWIAALGIAALWVLKRK